MAETDLNERGMSIEYQVIKMIQLGDETWQGTTDGLPTLRVLGVWIKPGAVVLHILFGTDVDWNDSE